MKKRQRAALHRKQRANAEMRAAHVYRRTFAEMRAETMNSLLTPAEYAVWNKLHRHD